MDEAWPDWRGQTAVVVACGPTAAEIPLAAARGKARFIAIKESWRLAWWADVLYATDGKWWQEKNGVPAFGGLKVSASPRAVQLFPDIRRVRLLSRPQIVIDDPGLIGCGSRYGNGNSGFHAINLAVQFGAKRIVLVGFDMRLDLGMHWHREKRFVDPTPSLMAEWREALDGCAQRFLELGIEVINVSQVSALTAYRKSSLMEAIGG